MAVPGEYNSSCYYFDDVVVDRENFRLLKGDQARTLEPRVFDLLIFLIDNRGRVLEKQELFEQVWKQAFVTDNALTRAVKEIRRVIGDDASAPRYIETIPKRGYRFIAEVRTTAEVAPPTQPAGARRPEELVAALHYKLLNKLGQGGGGVVYLAEDTRLKRTVVLKFLAEELAASEMARRRFLREARLASLLNHANICTIYEINEVAGLDFIVMQYVEGQPLKQVIAGHPLDLDSILAIAVQIAEALGAAHEQGIIHRDIKPGNLMVATQGQVKILDFGLAKSLACAPDEQAADMTELTRQGVQLGTPAYMSPEQARGERADHRSDIFSFGIVLYEMATGRVPFKCQSQAETMNAVINTPHTPLTELNKAMPPALAAVVDRALAKAPADRYQTIGQMLADLRQLAATPGGLRHSLAAAEAPEATVISATARREQTIAGKLKSALLSTSVRQRFALLAMLALILAAAVWLYWRNGRLRWAREQVVRVEQLAQAQNCFEAYDLAVKARAYLPDDPALERLMPMISDTISVSSEPAGASVYLKRFSPDQAGQAPPRALVGTTPIADLRIARGEYVIYIEKEGWAPVARTISNALSRFGTALLPPSYILSRPGDVPVEEPAIINQKLMAADQVPDRMVFIPGGEYQLVSWGKPSAARARLDDYLIDKYEVTNREYKEFVNAGGYLKPQYWKYPLIKEGRTLAWEAAMHEFRDRTGLPGPRSWVGQSFPEGRAEHPVTDITWHEAAAYAEFRGKRLPTIFQWEKAARDGIYTHYTETLMPWGPAGVGRSVEGRANFKSDGTVPVDRFEFGMSPYGCYNMAGNVAEWCLNETSQGFISGGASWDDLSYLFSNFGDYPAFYNSSRLGFRCAKTAAGATGDQGALRIDTAGEPPAYVASSNADFESWLSHYRYDKTPLAAEVLEVQESEAWRREKIAYNGADDDRVIAYLYLPKNYTGPYQVIQFVPAGDVYGGYITIAESVEMILPPLIQSGRAVFAVVFRGFKEREHPPDYRWPSYRSVKYREQVVGRAIDLCRGLDYLETRSDIDSSRIAYNGYSAGMEEGLVYAAVESRYRSVVMISGGLSKASINWIAEASPHHFAPHIRAPKLMLSGRYDEAYSFKMEIEPLYRLLSEPKRIIVYEAGHTPPIEVAVPAINDWLNETLGPVRAR